MLCCSVYLCRATVIVNVAVENTIVCCCNPGNNNVLIVNSIRYKIIINCVKNNYLLFVNIFVL